MCHSQGNSDQTRSIRNKMKNRWRETSTKDHFDFAHASLQESLLAKKIQRKRERKREREKVLNTWQDKGWGESKVQHKLWRSRIAGQMLSKFVKPALVTSSLVMHLSSPTSLNDSRMNSSLFSSCSSWIWRQHKTRQREEAFDNTGELCYFRTELLQRPFRK
jgi:hypothetical protein